MRALLVVLLVASLAGNAYLWMRTRGEGERARTAEARVKAAEERATAAEARAAAAQARVRASGDSLAFLTELEMRALRRRGLTDPVNQLRSDLAGQSSLIPIRGSMGGTMGFYDRAGVILLPGGFVYAPAEDGHYLVHTVLRYDVEPKGAIRWKLLDARRD